MIQNKKYMEHQNIQATNQDQVIQLTELDQAHIEVQTALNKLVWHQENLRQQLVDDPKGTMERELGVKFEPSIKVVIIDQADPDTVYYVLPQHPHSVVHKDLNDDELDAIAGGMSLLDSKMFPSYGNAGLEITRQMSQQLRSVLPSYYANKLENTVHLLDPGVHGLK